MTALGRLNAFFGRFRRPWLAALGAAGAVWLVGSVLLALLAAGRHPTLDLLIVALHLLGLAAVVAAGVVQAVFFWRGYFDRKFGG
jgi:hypothetical protein